MIIHNIPALVSYAFPKAMTPGSITAGFRSTGIYPFDRNIFQPEKFFPATTFERPLPEAQPVPVPVPATTQGVPATTQEVPDTTRGVPTTIQGVPATTQVLN